MAVITGAAHGIGAATAHRLAAEGALVVVTDVDDTAGKAVAAHIVDGGGHAEYVRCDVTSAADWENLARHVDEHHGRLDVLHSNAFAQLNKPAHELSEAEWDGQTAVLLKPAWRAMKTFASMLRTAKGSVVLTSSVHAVIGLPGHAAYAAAKGALCSLGRQLAVEYGPDIRVDTVLPGPILTAARDGIPEADRQRYGGHGGQEIRTDGSFTEW
ncbi:SDR family NAD(P)-dependent oxidoreductase [Streptomyces sp. NPDC013978]|uniref:SDR family NAD(P)-dependent oxidoreductase n=1 Tax=Streptomyces sp. NPDC013978 TaxID=3364869 RepID=UPI0036F55474